MHAYDTMTEAISDLKQRGFNIDFNVEEGKLIAANIPLALQPEEFEIAEVYRFEGETDPADEAIVYAIESRHGQKGILVNGYGPEADGLSDELVKKLSIKH